jgi:predicted amidophosphoribosyltransferase
MGVADHFFHRTNRVHYHTTFYITIGPGDLRARAVPVFAAGWYYPINRYGRRHDEWSSMILELKSMNEFAVEYFYQKIHPELRHGFAISVVPSSQSNKSSGIKMLAKELAREGRFDAVDVLVRHTSIPKQAYGGHRSFEQHLQTVFADPRLAHIVNNRPVLIMDDVMTTGNSLRACSAILLRSGAGPVCCLALAVTVR